MLLSVVAIVEAMRTGIGSVNMPGAGFFMFGAGICLFGFSVLLLIHNNRTSGHSSDSRRGDSPKGRTLNVILVLSACVTYAFLLEPLGFLPSTLLLMFFLFWGIQPQPWWVIFLGCIGSSSLSYIIFHVFLKVQLPIGFLGI